MSHPLNNESSPILTSHHLTNESPPILTSHNLTNGSPPTTHRGGANANARGRHKVPEVLAYTEDSAHRGRLCGSVPGSVGSTGAPDT